jgi:hypothetical protein
MHHRIMLRRQRESKNEIARFGGLKPQIPAISNAATSEKQTPAQSLRGLFTDDYLVERARAELKRFADEANHKGIRPIAITTPLAPEVVESPNQGVWREFNSPEFADWVAASGITSTASKASLDGKVSSWTLFAPGKQLTTGQCYILRDPAFSGRRARWRSNLNRGTYPDARLAKQVAQMSSPISNQVTIAKPACRAASSTHGFTTLA